MKLTRKLIASSVTILLAFGVAGSQSSGLIGCAFDSFGDINCEDEMARLDNFAIQLQNDPTSIGFIIFYGGRRSKGRLPKRGEAEARAARLKPYLVERRGIPKDRVVVLGWGYAEEWSVELWIVPRGARIPDRLPTVPAKEIRFRKGTARARDFRCEI